MGRRHGFFGRENRSLCRNEDDPITIDEHDYVYDDDDDDEDDDNYLKDRKIRILEYRDPRIQRIIQNFQDLFSIFNWFPLLFSFLLFLIVFHRFS